MSATDGGPCDAGMARRTRRLWTDEEKPSIGFQAAAPGVLVARVGLRYTVTANLIFKGLRDPRDVAAAAPRACQTKVDTGFVARHAEKQKVRVCLAILSSPDRL